MNLEITGTGRYIPEVVVPNKDFLKNIFYTQKGEKIELDPRETIQKFEEITGIRERRYARPDQSTSDLATEAAIKAIEDAGINPETLDGIFVAHNFGDIRKDQIQTDQVPSLAARVKYNLGIYNPDCIAFDLLYGCPGWIQALIVAYHSILAKQGKNYLIIGAESLSRTIDQHNRDCMIFSDGAGAIVVEARSEENHSGILSTASQTFAKDEAFYLTYDVSYNQADKSNTRFIRMQGRKIYEFSLKYVPLAMKTCLEKSGVPIGEVKKVLLHQANEKMDEAIIKRFYKLYDMDTPVGIMPMNIHLLGNSSVATIPTLLDLMLKGELEGHIIEKGDVIIMASVGAGMNINAITYKF